MDNEITTAIITSAVAAIASVISLFVSLKSLKVQKKLGNSSFQIQYLNEKLIRMDNLKNELTALDHNTNPGLENQNQFIKGYADYLSEIMVKIPVIIDKLEGHINEKELKKIKDKISKLKKFKASETATKLFGASSADEDFSIFDQVHPVDYLHQVQEQLKKFIIEEIACCRERIEEIMEIDIKRKKTK